MQGVTTSNVTGNLILVDDSVTVNKSFSPTTVALGSTSSGNPNFSTLSVQIRNNNAGAINLTGVGLTDTFPTGMVVANPATAGFSGSGCSGATITAPVGATDLVLSGASVNANSICTLSVRVVGTVSGNLIDSIPPGSISDTQGVTNPLQGTATLAVTGTVDLTITKSDGVTTVVPGTTTTYTIPVSNSGPDDVTGLGFTDTPPSGMTFTSWTCVATAGSACPASGSGPIATNLTVLNGGMVTFTVDAAIASSAVGSITNTASLAVPGSVVDTNPVTTASDTDTLTPQADLAISKSDGVTSVAPGTTTTYTIVATNNGPSDAPGATVVDMLPASITSATWTCVASGGSSCSAGSGSGSINTQVNLIAGGTATFTLVAMISPSATGTLTNTATIAPPAGVTDPNLSNNSATDTDTLTPMADLAITKTAGSGSVNAGASAVYTLVATNIGPSAVVGATVTDTAPAGLTFGSWTCAATAGSSCPASGSGNIAALVNLSNGGSATFTVNATVAGSASGSITNTATVAVPPGVTDPNPGNNSSSFTVTVKPVADLAITKSDGGGSVEPGGSTTYTIVVSNNGPSNVSGATVSDVLPAAITSDTFTAVGSGGATGFSASGSGNINDTVNLPLNATITYTLQANISSSASGNLVNTATVTAPSGVTDPNLSNNTATVSNTLTPQVTLVVVKTDGSATYTPGGTATYTVTVTDTGASDAENVSVTDALPPGVTLTAGVTCVGNGTSTCGSVTGAIGDTSFATTGATVGAAMGNSLVFTVPVAFASDLTTDPLVNTATATDLVSNATASGSDSNALSPQVTLAVAKTDGSTTYTPGGTATYTITVTHGGVSDATDITVSDALPAGLTLTATVTCAAIGDASCGAVTGLAGQTSFGSTGAQIAAGGGNSLVFTVPVAFDPAMVTDPVVNTATATDEVSGATGSGNDSNARSAQVSLSVFKTDGSASYTPGGSATYTITVTDTGLTDALNVTVADGLPAGVTLTGTVGCAANGSASCGTVTGSAGQTSFNASGATIGAGGGSSLVFTVPVAFASDLMDNPLVNSATAMDVPSGATGSGSDSDVLAPQASLVLTKTDGSTTYTPGGTATYTIVVTNGGPSDTFNTTVSDTLPPGVMLSGPVGCMAAGSADCGTVSGMAGQTSLGATGASIPAGAGNSLTFTAPVSFAADLTSNPLTNTATATDPASPPASGSDSNALSGQADLAITKTDTATTVVPGQTVTYTIVATNLGPSDAFGATVSDVVPAAVSSATWSCVPSGGGTCSGSGTGNIDDTVNLPVGATLTYTLVATLADSATGTLSNTATVSPPSGVMDPNLTNNSATVSNGIAAQADLAITKTDGMTSVAPGTTTTYTIVATNNGPSDAPGATVVDMLPASITSATWTCVASAASSCSAGSGSGSINTQVNLIAGGTATFTLVAMISPSATGTLTNTATIAPPAGVTDPNLSNNSATYTDTLTPMADLAITKTAGSGSVNAGASAVYTLVATNIGPSAVVGATVTDTAPAGLTFGSWTCVATAGSSCPASGSGNIAALVNLSNGGSATFTVNATVAGSASGSITNTATVAVPAGVTDPIPGNNSSSFTVTVNAVADLAITKDDGVTSVAPGASTTYTIVVSNAGPSPANGAIFTDPAVANLTVTSVTCASASGGAACPASTTVALLQGSGIVIPTLPSGSVVVFTVVATVSSGATGSIANTARIATPAGVTDPNLSNNSATDTDTVTALATLALTKTDGSATYTPGGFATYTLTLTNGGPSNASDVTVTDNLPSGVTLSASASCVETGAATCGTITGLAGGASFTATAASIAAGAGNVLTYSLPVHFAVSLTASRITNTATASSPTAVNVAVGSASTVRSTTGAEAIPADDRRGLLLLACLILFFGARQVRQARRARGAPRS